MADNIIQVNVTANKPKSVTVSSANIGTEITASSDTGRFWAQTSKNWAVSEALVDNTDYSSKYYANKASQSATRAQNAENAVRENYNSFLNASVDANNEIQAKKEDAVNVIDSSVQTAITTIDTKSSEAIDSINNTKTDIITDIEFVADGEKKEIEELAEKAKDDIESTGFYMRDDKLYFINSVGEEEEFNGKIEEKLSGKLDRSDVKAYIVETYSNSPSWYRVYSDGWCEQGGKTTRATTVNFLKAFKDTNYTIVTNCDSVSGAAVGSSANELTQTSFIAYAYSNGGGFVGATISWYACGYIR